VSSRGRRLGRRLRLRSGSDAPVHVQIEEQLAERIASGELHTGERLPPERDLARDLNVSRMTVRQALSSLAARGLVERGVGRGTFVAGRKVDHDLTRVAGFSEQLARQGMKPGAEIMDVSETPAGWRISAALEIAPTAPVVRIQRLRLADGVPMALEDSWFPAERFPGLAEETIDWR
jgi:GntR family transcriptional regulator